MSKKTLDIWGGVGSLLAGMICAWFAQDHNSHETMWKVWVGFSVLLVANGVAMILYAHRDKLTDAHPRH